MTLCGCRSGTELPARRKLVQLHDPAEGPRGGSGFQLVLESSLTRGQLVQPEDYMGLPTALPFLSIHMDQQLPYDKEKRTSPGQFRSVKCSSKKGSDKSHVACHLTSLGRGQSFCIPGDGEGLSAQ